MLFAAVVDNAVATLKAEEARRALEALEEVIKRVWVLERIDGGEPVNPVALHAEFAQPEHVLQAHPCGSCKFRPARGVTSSQNDFFHGLSTGTEATLPRPGSP